MSKARVFIETYGCSTNHSDSEIMKGILSRDYSIVDSPSESDLNIINTCIVKTPTENRMKFRIRELSKSKRPLIVAGCMSDTEKKIVERINPNASLVGSNSVENIGAVVEKTLVGERVVLLEYGKKAKVELPKMRKNSVIDIIQVASGCMGSCSFCQTRLARGTLKSYPPKLIYRSMEKGLSEGCKEFWLTSQDMGCYGLDIGLSLPQLLDGISGIDGKFLVRVGMMNPTHVRDFIDQLISSYRLDRIFKFLHLPVQSGSDRILRLMERNYKVDDFKDIVGKFRREFPSFILSTDMIVGFPGETASDFKKSMGLVKKVRPDVVNISAFGSRPGTKAAGMEQLPMAVIRDRTSEMSALVKDVMISQNERWKGWEGEVLVDDVVRGRAVGRNRSYKQVFVYGRPGEFTTGKIYP
ncbi:hypothetical protein A3K63_03975 [Candidatus Micrarchaeota archaeon RBG_16_49_10]|nr:MAG: hypothetical protein A3K63_03975 [Candidatus Micrarchaeota archaeon RBG_16_49_10]